MDLSLHNRTLIRGLLLGTLVITSAAACSPRSDRAETASDTTAAVLPDTVSSGAIGDETTAGTDTALGADTLRLQSDTGAAGAADRDTAAMVPPDTARQTEDTSETSMEADTATVETSTSLELETDTTTAGYTAMARDTSAGADQVAADTTAAANVAMADVAVEGEVAADTLNDGRIRPPEDSAEVGGQVETDTALVASIDTTTSEPIRPPEDSAEAIGVAPADSVPSEADTVETTSEAEPRETAVVDDEETVEEDAAADYEPSDEVGAAAIGGNVTGADAITIMTRQGARCMVSTSETDEDFWMAMADTPITLNPCGLGSMVPSSIWTGER